MAKRTLYTVWSYRPEAGERCGVAYVYYHGQRYPTKLTEDGLPPGNWKPLATFYAATEEEAATTFRRVVRQPDPEHDFQHAGRTRQGKARPRRSKAKFR